MVFVEKLLFYAIEHILANRIEKWLIMGRVLHTVVGREWNRIYQSHFVSAEKKETAKIQSFQKLVLENMYFIM